MTGAQGRQSGHLWPTPAQVQLLTAALGQGEAAVQAFAAWRADQDLEGDLPWPLLRLLPLVWDNLQRQGLDDPLMGRLKGVYRRFWCENQTFFFAMTPVLKALAEGGVRLLLLKGAPLVASYYRNPALRPMSDLDVAVPLAQLPQTLTILRDAGWWTGTSPSADDLRYFHAVFCGQGSQQLDLHYHLMRECVSEAADLWFWADVEPVEFQGVAAWQLAPTALLLHTVIHGMRWNIETPVRWIPDAVTVLRQRGDDVDWSRLLAFANAERLTGRLALGLGYLCDQFAVTLPGWVMERLASHRPGWRERIANTVVLGDSNGLYAHPLTKQWVMFADYCALTRESNPLRLAEGFSHYLRYRWQLRGRRELVRVAFCGLVRRFGRS